MRRTQWLVSLSVSGMVHLATLLAIAYVAEQGPELAALFVDLSNDSELITKPPPASSAAPRPTLSGRRREHPIPRPSRLDSERARAAGVGRVLDSVETLPTPSIQGAGNHESAPDSPRETPSAVASSVENQPEPVSVPTTPLEVATPAAGQPGGPGGQLSQSGSGTPSGTERSGVARIRGAGRDFDPVGLGGGDRQGHTTDVAGRGGEEPGGVGTGPEYGPYLTLWRTRIHENVRYPAAARRRNLAGTVHIEILIQANGAVGAVKLVESSSHGVLDTAVLESVKQLPPLPFPSHLAPRTIRARLPVVFEMR